MTWQPIVTDPVLKDRITQKLEEISTLLENTERMTHDAGLVNGSCGVLLFLCYNYQGDDSRLRAKKKTIRKLTANIYDQINKGFIDPTFSVGISGITWTLEHLANEKFIDLEIETCLILYDFISSQLIKHSNAKNFDFLHGATGMATCLLHSKSYDSKATLKSYVERLNENGHFENEFIGWKGVIYNEKFKPSEVINLSISHGVASILVLLTDFHTHYPSDSAEGIILIKEITSFFRNCKNSISQNPDFYYPSYYQISEKEFARHSRLAWCYGDLGVALSLNRAASVLNSE